MYEYQRQMQQHDQLTTIAGFIICCLVLYCIIRLATRK